MLQITQEIIWRGAAEFEHIHEVVPWPDIPSLRAVPLENKETWERAPTRMRAIKTHLDAAFVPQCDESKYLVCLRDPKDVFISSYYFLLGLMDAVPVVSVDDWMKVFTAEQGLGKMWADHTAGWWAKRGDDNVLVLTFDELKRDFASGVDQIAACLGVSLNATERTEVIRRCGFRYMKDHESKLCPPRFPFMDPDDKPVMIRSGQSGGSREFLDVGQQTTIDACISEALSTLGSDFPYAQRFGL